MLTALFNFIEKRRTLLFLISTICINICIFLYFINYTMNGATNIFAYILNLLFAGGIMTMLMIGYFKRNMRFFTFSFVLFGGFLLLRGILDAASLNFWANMDARIVLFEVFRLILALSMAGYLAFFFMHYFFNLKFLFVERLLMFITCCAAFVYFVMAIVYGTVAPGALWINFIGPLFFLGGLLILPVAASVFANGIEEAAPEVIDTPVEEEKAEEELEEEPVEEEKEEAPKAKTKRKSSKAKKEEDK